MSATNGTTIVPQPLEEQIAASERVNVTLARREQLFKQEVWTREILMQAAQLTLHRDAYKFLEFIHELEAEIFDIS